MDPRSTPATVAEAYLALLRDRGVDRLFVNAGTDFAPVVEAYARRKESSLDFPEPIVCTHENLAVSMAHGAYLASGHPQAVMLHTNVGTANAICAVINASRDRIPIMVTAGRTPLFERPVLGARSSSIHWGQEMYDQGGMLRELVKWDYELRDGVQVDHVVDRALNVSMAQPRGPVYLTLPREVLARPADPATLGPRVTAVPTEPYPSQASVSELADLLVKARFPMVVVTASGLDHRSVVALERLCERFAIGVLEVKPRCYNVSPSHRMHLGYDGRSAFDEADVVCVLDVDVPWVTATMRPAEGAVVVQCGPDPSFTQYPMRTHRADLAITAGTQCLLEMLLSTLAERPPVDEARRSRIERVASAERRRREALVVAELESGGRITKAFMNRALAEVLPTDATVVNEYWARPEQLPIRDPGSYFGTPVAGGLGWALPAALGIRLAQPERTVVATLGDGAYLFANPAACHDAMAMHNLPVLTIVCANRKWGAVELSTLGMYPTGHTAAAGELTPLARLNRTAAFERYAQASGGHGEAVTDPDELVPALRRALHAVRVEHRQALVNVACD